MALACAPILVLQGSSSPNQVIDSFAVLRPIICSSEGLVCEVGRFDHYSVSYRATFPVAAVPPASISKDCDSPGLFAIRVRSPASLYGRNFLEGVARVCTGVGVLSSRRACDCGLAQHTPWGATASV